eukprot:887381-Pyramimonas_sp.AAC.1
MGCVDSAPPAGEAIGEAMKAAMIIDQYVSTPAVEESPAEKGQGLHGPEEHCISAHWRKAYRLTRKKEEYKTCFRHDDELQMGSIYRVRRGVGPLIDALCHCD